MSFESPDNEKNFPVSEDDHDRGSKKKDLGKKKDGKKDKKEKGYIMFEEEESEEDMVALDDVKSPTKAKKVKAGFKFPARFPKKEKEEKKEKEIKKEEKKKEEKEGKKHKLKDKKKSKHGHHEVPAVVTPSEYDKPIFGVPLALAVERNKSHDGIELPAIFRECVDYIEEYGLSCEGIYRISGVKSKVQHLKDLYNKGAPAYLEEHEPNVVASLLKQFLRDLPEPVLTTAMMPKFEEASTIKSERKRIEQFRKLIDELPACNRLLLSWMIVHMTHIIELQKENKMTLQNVSIVLSPTMQISHRVLNILFTYAKQLFVETIVKRYVPPLKPATSRWSLELPDNPAALEEELGKQESLLNQLHGELNAGVTDSAKEEQLWEVQRVVTQLKRKIKFAKKAVEAAEKRRKDIENKKLSSHPAEDEDLHLDLRVATKRTESTKGPAPKRPLSKEETAEIPAGGKTDEEKVKDTEKSESEANAKKEEQSREDHSQDEAKSQKETENSETVVKRHSMEKSKRDSVEKGKRDSGDKSKRDSGEKSKRDSGEKSKRDSGEQSKKDSVERSKRDSLERTKRESSEKTKRDSSEEEKRNATGDKVVKITVKADVVKSADDDTAEDKVNKDSAEKDSEDTQEENREMEETQLRKDDTEKKAETIEPKTPQVKNVEKVSLQPHIHLTSEPLQPIKAEQPVTPKKDETADDSMRKSVELRELEEELLGDGKSEKRRVTFTEDERVVEEDEEEEDVETPETEVEVVDRDWEPIDDEEMQKLLEEEEAMKMEEEELLAIGDELRQKIETEQSEIERLHQEIQELHYLRQDSDLEDMSSSSDSSYDSEDEEDLQDILSQLIHDNEHLEKKNAELCQKIHEERMICLSVKLQIRLLQQKQLETSQSSVGGADRETFL